MDLADTLRPLADLVWVVDSTDPTLGSMARLHVDAPAPDRMYVVFTTAEEPDLIVTLDDSRQVLCHIKRFRRHSISRSIPELRED